MTDEGGNSRCRIGQLCNYLKTILSQPTQTFVASIISNTSNPSNTHSFLKADSGASKHFIRQEDESECTNIETIVNGPAAKLPNNQYIFPSNSTQLPFSELLSEHAKSALIYPALKNASLLSIGQLCDDDCLAIFHKYFLWILKDQQIVLQGTRNKRDGLWDVPFQQVTPYNKSHRLPNKSLVISNIIQYSQPDEYRCNYILTLDKSKFEMAQYLYGSLYAPAISTLQKAIKRGNLISWPGIDTINFKKYVGANIAHEKGHLDQERQNLWSTKKVLIHNNLLQSLTAEEIDLDAFPSHVDSKSYDCFSVITSAPEKSEKGISYSDQTGCFPYQSSSGNKYICVTYNYDANAFLFELLKNRESSS